MEISTAPSCDTIRGGTAAGDGTFGGVVHPSGGIGTYKLASRVVMSTGESFADATGCRVVNSNDLSITSSDITLTRNRVQAGDSVAVLATVHNSGPEPALRVAVEITDGASGAVLGQATMDVAANGAATVQIPWKVASPDSHLISVHVSPFAFAGELNYTNNTASRLIILGHPLAVELTAEEAVWLAPVYPNPSAGVARLAFSVPKRSTVDLEIFDILGRRIHRWVMKDLEPGRHVVEWDGRDGSGSMMAPGVLIARLHVGNISKAQKFIYRR